MAVKNINDQPVKSATYLWGVDNLGLACRVTPYVSPVLSVVGPHRCNLSGRPEDSPWTWERCLCYDRYSRRECGGR